MFTSIQSTPSRLGLVLALSVITGCYTGLADMAGVDQGTSPDPSDIPSDDNGPENPSSPGDDGDDGMGQPPGSPPFSVPNDEARLLPFPVRMQNLARLVGQSQEHPIFFTLYELRYQLGDHNFAFGVAPDLRWSAEKMQHWVKGIKPVCASAELQEAYPELLTDPRPFIQQAWGHTPEDSEVEALASLRGPDVSDQDAYTMSCIVILSALNFVSI